LATPQSIETALHRAGQPVGEWLLQIVQLQAAGRMPHGEIFHSLKEAQIVIERWGCTATQSDRIRRSAIDRQRPKPSGRHNTFRPPCLQKRLRITCQLEQKIGAGDRLCVFPIKLPPLRDPMMCRYWPKSSSPYLTGSAARYERPGLLNVQSGPLQAPFERDLDVPSRRFCSKTGRRQVLHNGLNDIRREDSQAD
jgi:hypothetical protein